MKILSVKIKNLNSIVCENPIVIDFTLPPLSETGLFAITGETGAGKSTILDAISLAMYNAIPRGSSEDDIMSYGTAEAFAEVVFETIEGKYMATWIRKRAHNKSDGALQKSDWKLANVTDPSNHKIIAEKKKDVEREIINITGLDVDKFTQSVLLAQGKFAAFMQAKPNVRGELLEKITMQTDFSKYSIAAYKKYQDEQNILSNLKESLGKDSILSEEECKYLESQIEDLNKQSTQHKNTLELIVNSLNWLEAIEQNNIKKAQAKTNFDIASNAIANATDLKAKLEAHNKTIPFAEALGALTNIERDITTTNETLNLLKVELPLLEKQMQDARQQLNVAITEKKEIDDELLLLEPQFTQATKLDENIKNSKINVENLSAELINLENQIKVEQSKLAEKQKIHTSQKSELIDLELWLNKNSNWAKIGEVLALVQTKFEEYSRQKASFNEKSALINKNDADLTLLTAKLSETEKELVLEMAKYTEIEANQKQKTLDIQKLLANSNLKQVRENHSLVNKKMLLFTNLVRIAKEWETVGLEKENHLKKYKSTSENKSLLLEKTEIKEKEINQLKELIASVEDNCKFEQLVKNYDIDRQKLVEGKECFLCGSIHHPWINGENKPIDSVYEQQLIELKAKQETANAELIKLMSLTPSNTELETLNTAIDLSTQKIANLLIEFNTLAEANNEKNLAIDTKHLLIEKQLMVNTQYLLINETILKAENLETELKDLQTISEIKKEKLHTLELMANKLQTECKALKSTIETAKKETAELKTLLETQATELKTTIEPYINNVADLKTDEIVDKLNQMKHTFDNKQHQKSKAEIATATLNAEIKEIESTLKPKLDTELPLRSKTKQEANEFLNTIQTQRQIILKGQNVVDVKQQYDTKNKTINLNIEKQRSVLEQFDTQFKAADVKNKELAIRLAQISTEKEKKTSEILTKANGIFNSVDNIKAARIDDNQYLSLNNQWIDLNNTLTNTKAELEAITKLVDSELNKNVTTQNKNDLITQKNNITQQEILVANQVAEHKAKIINDEKIKLDKAHITKAIETQTIELKRWANLNDLIGSANGDRFRKFAQSITLRLLADKANAHLQQISGRYQTILQKEKIATLELDIIDNYQGNNIRPMNTLSGGETFLVSLALALGLSDMASGKNPVESLFIDEGFGSLDPETLNTALSALENLQSSGKTIGIISHVEQLKDRIPCQIQVIKKGSGTSIIKIV